MSRGLLCRTAKEAEHQISSFMNLERGPGRWRVRETTITDVILSRLYPLRSNKFYIDVSNEITTGADLDIIFTESAGGKLRTAIFCLQAKRSDRSSGLAPYWYYKEIFHPNNTGSQCKGLVSYCNSIHANPFYLFYHSQDCAKATGANPVSICRAEEVKKESYIKYDTNNRRVDRYLHQSTPFHKIFCVDNLEVLIEAFGIGNEDLIVRTEQVEAVAEGVRQRRRRSSRATLVFGPEELISRLRASSTQQEP